MCSITVFNGPVIWLASTRPLSHAGSSLEIAAHRYTIPSSTRISRSAHDRTGVSGRASIDSATLRVAARPGEPGLAIDSATLRVAARPGEPGLAIDSATLRVAARPGEPGLAIGRCHGTKHAP